MADLHAHHILLVDDDHELASMIQELFEREGWTVHLADSGQAAQAWLERQTPDAVVLDLMLGDIHGLTLCADWRKRWPGLAVLILTARGDPMDRILGLELGADDYLPKPFVARELVARVRSLLRRSQRPESTETQRLQVGSLLLDLPAREVRVGDQQLPLTGVEFKLLWALARQPGVVLSRQQLSEAVQPGEYRPLDRTVDVQVARLRRKLKAVSNTERWIDTQRGEGYVLICT